MELSSRRLQRLFSRRAFSFYSNRLDSYVIAYNDSLPLLEIIYHVFHEIGHVYYGHISPGNSFPVSLAQQETAANHFAAFIFCMIGGVKMQTLTGNEHFTYEGMPVGILLNDFWAWNSSDLLNNTLRGALAEFIVASAVGIDTTKAREDWTAYDLLTESGRKIEVKCSAYLQSWNTEKLSRVQFSIRPARSWDAENDFSDDVKRWSDLYVFCLYASKDRNESPLQLEQWEFFLLPTYVLDEQCGEQKSITLSSLLSLSPVKTTYDGLRDAVDNLSTSSTPPPRTSVLI
ncbi:ImmA/IrrE family metallo-endopeptidase [Faecalicatena contorta]|uniref:ImmA/IrrE family metallo-endopeptidase n=1 Tax=Faecalicatena contorta TaxID=39482 RepID=UPI00189B7376|nr:hypothetical protein [Faecalicatena contorta]